MRKIIILFIALMSVVVSACAENGIEIYTPFGNGVQLITKQKHSYTRGDKTVYGLRKDGVVLERPTTSVIIVPQGLGIIIFQYKNGVNIYNLDNGAKVGEFFISRSLHGGLHNAKVTVKSVRKNGKRCYTVHYSNYTDRLGQVEHDVETYCRENGKLYKLDNSKFIRL